MKTKRSPGAPRRRTPKKPMRASSAAAAAPLPRRFEETGPGRGVTSGADDRDSEPGDCYLVRVEMLVFGFKNQQEIIDEVVSAFELLFHDRDDLLIEVTKNPP